MPNKLLEKPFHTEEQRSSQRNTFVERSRTPGNKGVHHGTVLERSLWNIFSKLFWVTIDILYYPQDRPNVSMCYFYKSPVCSQHDKKGLYGFHSPKRCRLLIVIVIVINLILLRTFSRTVMYLRFKMSRGFLNLKNGGSLFANRTVTWLPPWMKCVSPNLSWSLSRPVSSRLFQDNTSFAGYKSLPKHRQ